MVVRLKFGIQTFRTAVCSMNIVHTKICKLQKRPVYRQIALLTK